MIEIPKTCNELLDLKLGAEVLTSVMCTAIQQL